MAAFRKHINLVRLVAIIAGGTLLSACMEWQTQSLQPERFRTADSTQSARLILSSGDTLIVTGLVIAGDSLLALRSRGDAAPDSLERVSMPLAGVSEVQIRKEDRVANVALGIPLAILVLVAIHAAACGQNSYC